MSDRALQEPILSVVIPTYIGRSLFKTLGALFSCDISGLAPVEVCVVDDGSPQPIAPVVESVKAPAGFVVWSHRQANAGPAAARNAGFAMTRGKIVLFLDDDILLPPHALRCHVEAHERNSRSVIFGRCALRPPIQSTPIYEFMESLGNDVAASSAEEFVPVDRVASGQLSVERDVFLDGTVYEGNLRIPGGEEHALAYRLACMKIDIRIATRCVALHDHPTNLESFCKQEYKHGYGAGEVSALYPDVLQLPDMKILMAVNGQIEKKHAVLQRLKLVLKQVGGTKRCRTCLIVFTNLCEKIRVPANILFALYRITIGLHIFAGFRQGLRDGNNKREVLDPEVARALFKSK